MGQILVGTASWADPGFVEHWYPEGLPARDRLPWYAERFEAVEVNSTSYAIPAESTVEGWVEATPEAFTFDVKLHRALSRHAAKPESLPKDLRSGHELTSRGNVVLDAELERALIERTREAFAALGSSGKLGAFLCQLTPAFDPRKHELTELDALVAGLRPHPVAVEFRHIGWVEGNRFNEVRQHLSEIGATFVGVDAPRERHVPILPPVDALTTTELAYIRCHGRNAEGYMRGRTVAERFDYDYSDDELVEIADRAQTLGERAEKVHVVFNNNARELAPKAARRFRELVGQNPGPSPG
jgi:uncharacterized protein YecE (DUF72 family)